MNAPTFGTDEHGHAVGFDFLAPMHTSTGGGTRSGKTVTSYSILAAAAQDARVCVVGVDPSGILLAPHLGNVDGRLIHLGTDDAGHAIDVVEALVRVMDARIRLILDHGHDKVPDTAFGPQFPVYLIVLEEYAGTLAWLQSLDQTRKPAERLHPRMVSAVGRLLREGAKAGLRVFTILQRPEAAVLHDRAQYSRRISHRLDNADSVRMLFEGADSETIQRLMNVRPGVGLIHEAGESLRFFRADYLDYAAYRAAVLGNESGTT